MSDIDFDELDRAVHDLMRQSGQSTNSLQQNNTIADNTTSTAPSTITPAVDDSSEDTVENVLDDAVLSGTDSTEVSAVPVSASGTMPQGEDPFAVIAGGDRATQISTDQKSGLQDFLHEADILAVSTSTTDANLSTSPSTMNVSLSDKAVPANATVPPSSTVESEQSSAEQPSSLVEQALRSLEQHSLPQSSPTSMSDVPAHAESEQSEQSMSTTVSNVDDATDGDDNVADVQDKGDRSITSTSPDKDALDADDVLAEQVLESEREPDSGVVSETSNGSAAAVIAAPHSNDDPVLQTSSSDPWPSFGSADISDQSVNHSLDDIITPAFSQEEPLSPDNEQSLTIAAQQSASHTSDLTDEIQLPSISLDGDMESSIANGATTDNDTETMVRDLSPGEQKRPMSEIHTNDTTSHAVNSSTLDEVSADSKTSATESEESDKEDSQKSESRDDITIDAVEAEQPTGTYGNAIHTISPDVDSSREHQTSLTSVRSEPAIIVSPRPDQQASKVESEPRNDDNEAKTVANDANDEILPQWTKTRDGEPLESTGVAYDEGEIDDEDTRGNTVQVGPASELPHVDVISTRATANSYRPDVVMVEGNDTTEVEPSDVNATEGPQSQQKNSVENIAESVSVTDATSTSENAWPEFAAQQSDHGLNVAVTDGDDSSAVQGGEGVSEVSYKHDDSSRGAVSTRIITTHSRPLVAAEHIDQAAEAQHQSSDLGQSETHDQPRQSQSIVQRPRGRFMDIVAGSSAAAKTLDQAPKTSVRRHGKVVAPLGVGVSSSADTGGLAAPVVGMDIRPTPGVSGVMHHTATAPLRVVTPKQIAHIEDDMAVSDNDRSPATEATDQDMGLENNMPTQSGDDSRERNEDDGLAADSSTQITNDIPVQNDLQPGDEKPLDYTTPFLPDAIVEKRPLNSEASAEAISPAGVVSTSPAPEHLFADGDVMMGSAEKFINALSDTASQPNDQYPAENTPYDNSVSASTDANTGWHLQEDKANETDTALFNPIQSYDTMSDPAQEPWPAMPDVYQPNDTEPTVPEEGLPLPETTIADQATDVVDSSMTWQDDDFGHVRHVEEMAATTQNGDTALALHQALQGAHDDRSAAPVYSDEEYAHPHDKKARRRPEQAAGWIWLLWIVLLLAVGAGIGAAYFALFG